MAFMALTGLVPQWIEPERYDLSEKGELIEREDVPDELVRVEIKPLNGREYYSVLQNPGEASKLACSIGVTGWDNFKDGNGSAVEFSKVKILEFIPAKYIAIIGAKIMEISSVDGAKAKN